MMQLPGLRLTCEETAYDSLVWVLVYKRLTGRATHQRIVAAGHQRDADLMSYAQSYRALGALPGVDLRGAPFGWGR